MILEDETMVRELWAETLDDAGYAVFEAEDGAAALASLAAVVPDLILLDLTIPGMTGFEFLARLRANPRWARIPVLVVSGLGQALAQAIAAQDARQLGIQGVLAKPVPLATLLEHVARLTVGVPFAPPPPPSGH